MDQKELTEKEELAQLRKEEAEQYANHYLSYIKSKNDFLENLEEK